MFIFVFLPYLPILEQIADMLATHRRDKILELLREDGSAKVLNLAKIFKVTEVTIRQDLEK